MARRVSLRAMREDDLATMFEIQLDAHAQHLAAFTDATSNDRDAYLAKFRRILADDAIVNRVVEVDGEVVGSAAVFPIEGDTEVTYWIQRGWWGRGVATATLAALLEEVPTRPLHARVAEDNPAPSGCWSATGSCAWAARTRSRRRATRRSRS
ncbi:GNAT family N-acetyltransferase [Oerskovia sp. M15]